MKRARCRDDKAIDFLAAYFATLGKGYALIEDAPCAKRPQCGDGGLF